MYEDYCYDYYAPPPINNSASDLDNDATAPNSAEKGSTCTANEQFRGDEIDIYLYIYI